MILSKLGTVYNMNAVVLGEEYTIPVTRNIADEEENTEEPENNEDGEDTGDGIENDGDGEAEEDEEDEEEAEARRLKEEEEEIMRIEAEIAARREKELAELAELEEKERIKNEIVALATAQANRTSELIISHTLENARAELGAAASQGYSDGFESGRNEALGIVSAALEKINLLAGEITKMQDEMLRDFEEEMFNITAEISRRVLKREIDEKDEYLVVLFEEAVRDIKAESFVTVTVSESQTGFAVRNIDLFKSKVANIEDFRIISDKDADRGTMIVETEKTVADASFSVQMDEIDAVINQMKENLSADLINI
ncbi:MAG: FliH/SctL family protein [Oscillospiraceae bacterium]|nr:FliH/SctL family protein [Oscillospiraceae bacterium]